MPVLSAICDIVTERSPCSATSAAVVSRVASRTARRCASIVSFHSFGTTQSYVPAKQRQSDCLGDSVPRKLPRVEEGTGGDRDLAPATGTPRWVYVSGAIALVVVLVVVIVHLA